MLPRIHATPAVARQCCPNPSEYSARAEGRRRAHHGLRRQAPPGVDGPLRAADEAPREALLRVEQQRIRRSLLHGFARVPAHKGPFLHLPLQLNHVQRVIARSRIASGSPGELKYAASPLIVTQGSGTARSPPYSRNCG